MIVRHQSAAMARIPVIVCLLLPLGVALSACADRKEEIHADQMEDQAAIAQADDQGCQGKGQPGSDAYNDCRRALAEARAQQAEIKYQKARDFDRVLGAGTDGLSNNY
jgi:hypothetical protein